MTAPTPLPSDANALPGESIGPQNPAQPEGGSSMPREVLSSEKMLAALRANCKDALHDPDGPWVPLHPDIVLALVEYAEAACRLRITMTYGAGCSCGDCKAKRDLAAALAKLEAL